MAANTPLSLTVWQTHDVPQSWGCGLVSHHALLESLTPTEWELQPTLHPGVTEILRGWPGLG